MKTYVVKLSSQLMVRDINPFVFAVYRAMRSGDRVVVVTGGAVMRGLMKLKIDITNPTTLEKQAAAGIGQLQIMDDWVARGHVYGLKVAQLQYTHQDFQNPDNNIREVIGQLFSWGVLPVANGNDVAIDEETRLTAQMSENCGLARLLAELIGTDTMALLGITDGVYTADPRVKKNAQLIREVTDLSENFIGRFSDNAQNGSFGGMRTTVEAAVLAARAGIKVIVTSGLNPENLTRIFRGEEVIGTVFRPQKKEGRTVK